MTVIELAGFLSELWVLLSTIPSQADQSNTWRLGYTVRGCMDAGGQMKRPHTGGGVHE